MTAKFLIALSAGYALAEVTWTEVGVLFAACLCSSWLVYRINVLRKPVRSESERLESLRKIAAPSYRPVLVIGRKR